MAGKTNSQEGCLQAELLPSKEREKWCYQKEEMTDGIGSQREQKGTEIRHIDGRSTRQESGSLMTAEMLYQSQIITPTLFMWKRNKL